MSDSLTVKEASQLTGKSPSSIRRIIYPIIRDDAHPDRTQIKPTVDDARRLRTQGENFAWRISEELLRREMPLTPAVERDTGEPSPVTTQAESELLAMLRRELEIKNLQIKQQAELSAKQMELMSSLGERLREGNILIASLQQRLALTDGRTPTVAESPKPKRGPSSQPEKGSSIVSKPAKPKKSFLARIFG